MINRQFNSGLKKNKHFLFSLFSKNIKNYEFNKEVGSGSFASVFIGKNL